ADHATAGLDDRLGHAVAEMLGKRVEDRLAIGLSGRNIAKVTGRETAAHVDHAQMNASRCKLTKDIAGVSQRTIPGRQVGLLRTYVEGHAISIEAKVVGMTQHVYRHGRNAAELARQRPLGAFAIGQNAAEYLGAGGGTRNLLHFLDTIDRKEAHTQLERTGDITLLLDRVAIGNTIRRRTSVERHFDLSHRGGVEGRTQRNKQTQDFR